MDDFKALKQEKLVRQRSYHQTVTEGNQGLLRGSRYGAVRINKNILVRLTSQHKGERNEQK